LSRVSRPFYQAPRSDRPSRGGLGLGLFLARALTELHGGSFQMESVEGHGSTFRLSLPGGSPTVDPQRVSEAVSTPDPAQSRSPRASLG